MCGCVDLLRIYTHTHTHTHIYIYFTKKDVTHIVSVFRWDVVP